MKRFERTVSRIEWHDGLVEQYAKRILSFAYSKTRDGFLAEDLSQEILCSLADSLRRQDEVANMDGFVYTICCHTWSKYLRRNKKHWNNVDIELLYQIQSDQDVEQEAVTSCLIEKLRREVAYLSALHRKITVLYYYENRTGREIAGLLHIPSATVRWHLSQVKEKLKVGMEMKETLAYQPKRLWCGHDGMALDLNMHGLGNNPLVDNICIACYGAPLTVEELSRTLQVAAAYIEPLVQDLAYMDYLQAVGGNRYRTNFFIYTRRFQLQQARYTLRQVGPCAQKLWEAFRAHLEDICAIGFVGSHLDRDFLLWALMPLSLQRLYYSSLGEVLRKNHVQLEPPKRKDGSQHWVKAGLTEEDPDGFTPEEIAFEKKANGNGIKTRSWDSLHSLQYDGYATMQAGIFWREFDPKQLFDVERMAELVKTGESPNKYDKTAIASLVGEGYARVKNDVPELMIPFFDAEEYGRLREQLDIIEKEAGQTLFTGFIEGYARTMEKEIPGFLPPDIRRYLKYQAYPQYAVLYWLADKGYLRYPTVEEAKRLCTVVWCE